MQCRRISRLKSLCLEMSSISSCSSDERSRAQTSPLRKPVEPPLPRKHFCLTREVNHSLSAATEARDVALKLLRGKLAQYSNLSMAMYYMLRLTVTMKGRRRCPKQPRRWARGRRRGPRQVCPTGLRGGRGGASRTWSAAIPISQPHQSPDDETDK